jgi:hypothetical protein
MTGGAQSQQKQIVSLAQHWAWRLYYSIPCKIRVAGLHFDQFLRNLKRRFPLVVLHAPVGSDGLKASVVIAGARPWAEYLPRALLEGPFECTQLGSVPLWQLPRTLRERAPSASLCIARVDRIAARLLFGPGYLRVPELVDLWLEIPEDPGSLYRGKRNSTLRNDLNRAERNGLTCEISHREADLVDFYRRFHVPFVHERFERFAWPHNLPFLHGHFRDGGLVWVTQQGQRVAGCVFGLHGGVATALALGTRGGDYTAVELGAHSAALDALIKHAHHLGCREINFGGSRPLLTNGNLRFKRKWGMRVARRPQTFMHLLNWERLDPCLLDMLTGSGLIFEHQGHLSALSVLDGESRATAGDVASAHRFLRMAGIETLCLCSRSGFEPDSEAPPNTRLIDLASLGPADLFDVLTSERAADL